MGLYQHEGDGESGWSCFNEHKSCKQNPGFDCVHVCCGWAVPGDRVLVKADSQPPVPVPVKMKGVPASVWKTYLQQSAQTSPASKCVLGMQHRRLGKRSKSSRIQGATATANQNSLQATWMRQARLTTTLPAGMLAQLLASTNMVSVVGAAEPVRVPHKAPFLTCCHAADP